MNSDISTPEKLALVISDESIARYKDIPDEPRRLWIGSQIYALCLIMHYQAPSPLDVEIDANFADQMIMEDEGIRCLKQVEMQEAFRRGISREYGDFFGITASSLIQFLKGYRQGEKRSKAIAMLYDQEQKKQLEEQRRFDKAMYEAKLRGFKMPFWCSTRGKKGSLHEDTAKHRELIEKQREEILKQADNGHED